MNEVIKFESVQKHSYTHRPKYTYKKRKHNHKINLKQAPEGVKKVTQKERKKRGHTLTGEQQ
jgi:hypothetical protein